MGEHSPGTVPYVLHSYTRYIIANRCLGEDDCVDHDQLQAEILKPMFSKEPGI